MATTYCERSDHFPPYYFAFSSGHVPFRDSKLTRILQNSLSGNARVAVICTISPAALNSEESTNTLKFASRVKKVVTRAQTNQVSIYDYIYMS